MIPPVYLRCLNRPLHSAHDCRQTSVFFAALASGGPSRASKIARSAAVSAWYAPRHVESAGHSQKLSVTATFADQPGDPTGVNLGTLDPFSATGVSISNVNVATGAIFTNAEVCVVVDADLDGIVDGTHTAVSRLAGLHFVGNAFVLQDTRIDGKYACVTVTSLSPVAFVAAPEETTTTTLPTASTTTTTTPGGGTTTTTTTPSAPPRRHCRGARPRGTA